MDRSFLHDGIFVNPNGNPLQCSCLENPRDGEAWWAAVYGVTQSGTRLKRFSSSSSSMDPHHASCGRLSGSPALFSPLPCLGRVPLPAWSPASRRSPFPPPSVVVWGEGCPGTRVREGKIPSLSFLIHKMGLGTSQVVQWEFAFQCRARGFNP